MSNKAIGETDWAQLQRWRDALFDWLEADSIEAASIVTDKLAVVLSEMNDALLAHPRPSEPQETR